MLNHIWAVMLIAGMIYGMLTGNLQVMTNSMLGAAGDAVNLSITLLGVVAFWCGMMEIAQQAGLVEALSHKMKPVIHFLFPNIPEGHKSLEAISMNFMANILGLGWAATPAGLRAIEYLAELEEERESLRQKTFDNFELIDSASADPASANPVVSDSESMEMQKKTGKAARKGTASNEMCTFLVLNISSLQLIPVNIIAYRSQYGSLNPTAVVGPAIAATAVSTMAAIVICKIVSGSAQSS